MFTCSKRFWREEEKTQHQVNVYRLLKGISDGKGFIEIIEFFEVKCKKDKAKPEDSPFVKITTSLI
jgi:hypothetical protein